MPRLVGDEDLEKLALLNKGAVAILFFDYSSMPCRLFRAEWDATAGNFPAVPFFELNVAENPGISDDLGIRAVPTTLIMKNGTELKRFEGPYSREALSERFRAALGL
jgi:thioredoxin-like negative regulator of GroEL